MQNNSQNNSEPKFTKLKDRFSGGQASVMFLLALFAPVAIELVYSFLVIGLVGSDQAAINDFLDKNAWLNWLLNALLQIAFIAVFVLYSRREKVDFLAAAKIKKKLKPLQIIIIAGIAVAVLFAFDPLTILFEEFLKFLGYKPSEAPLVVIDSWGTFITAFFTVCILPALGEELIYRGTLTSGLSEYGKRTAILLSGLCFSLMHQNPEQTMHQFLLGCVLAWVFLETQSFWAPAIIHFLNNFVIVIIEFYSVYYLKADASADLIEYNALPLWDKLGPALLVSLFAAPALLALLYALKKVTPARPKEENPEEQIKVSVMKLPFADVLSGGATGDEKLKEVEEVVRAQAKKSLNATKAAQKKTAFTAIFGGLAFCLVMWLIIFFNVEL